MTAFTPCRNLRRLDLSGNVELGMRAFEVLARLYVRERPIDPLPAGGHQSVLTLPEDHQFGVDGEGDFESGPDATSLHDDDGHGLSKACILPYRCGLRSLPYLTLHSVGLTEGGALFLSLVLEQHYFPIQLITATNAAEATSHITIYRQDVRSAGIDWDHNDHSLSKDGMHLMEQTGKARLQLLSDSESISGSLSENFDMISMTGSTNTL